MVAAQEERLFATAPEIRKLGAWVEKTRHGDRAELNWLSGTSPFWQRICCQHNFCLGGKSFKALQRVASETTHQFDQLLDMVETYQCVGVDEFVKERTKELGGRP